MLSTEYIRKCLRIRSFISDLKLLPLEVDVGQGCFRAQKSGWKLLLCHILYLHLLFRAFFAHYRVLHALVTGQYDNTVEPHLLTWDIVMLLAATMYSSWYAIFFVCKPDNQKSL